MHTFQPQNTVNQAASKDAVKREQSRANKESGDRMVDTGRIGGAFTVSTNPAFLAERSAVFDRLLQSYNENIESKGDIPIKITLPNGDVKDGFAFKTSALDIAKGISQGLADSVVIAKVAYTTRLEDDNIIACDEDEEAQSSESGASDDGELWDLNRPLVGDCRIKLLKFDDPEAKTVKIQSSKS